eukprot:1605009-Pleurochrysis_carterae.AAC.1
MKGPQALLQQAHLFMGDLRAWLQASPKMIVKERFWRLLVLLVGRSTALNWMCAGGCVRADACNWMRATGC